MASDGRQSYFCFLHLSIQELLAAVHISHMSAKQQISVFQELFGTPRFSAVLQFYAGITKLKTRLSEPLQSPHQGPTSVYDLVRDIVRDSKHSKPLLVTLLHCLYEAEDPQLCQFVADLLGHRLTFFNLTNTTLTPLDCLAVGYFLSVVTTTCTISINTVDLANCSIGDQECKFFVRGLYKCLNAQSKITSQLNLVISINDIHEEGIHHIAQLLQNTSVVRKLVLTHNPIGDGGLKRLCEALSTNTTLEELALADCSINSGPLLGQLLSENTSLHRLSLSGNKITDWRSIAAGLSKNRTLRELMLYDCGLTDKSVENLSTGLNDYIQHLNIVRNYSITEGGLNVLVRRLTTLSGMRQLAISSRLVSPIIPVLNEVNEERRRNGLPEIELEGGCNCLFIS